MSSAPLEVSAVDRANMACVLLRAKQLGFATGEFTMGNAVTKNLTAIATPYPCRVEVKTQLASGSGTLTASVNAAGTYVGADATLALAGTTEQVLTFDTTVGNLFANLRILSGTSCVFTKFSVKVLALLGDGDTGEVRTAFNAVRSQVGTWTAGEADG